MGESLHESPPSATLPVKISMTFLDRRRPGIAQRTGYLILSRLADRAPQCLMPQPRGAKAPSRLHAASSPNVGLPLSLPPTRATECLEELLETGGMAVVA